MRKVLLFMFLAIMTSNSYSQEEAIKFSEVVNEEGKTVQELYPIIKAWIASSFKSAKDVIQMDDPDNGILICKGAFDYKYPGGGMNYTNLAGYVTYTLKIQVREGRYKVDMTDFIHRSHVIQFNETWSIGLITTREKYTDKPFYKNYNNSWKSIKIKSQNQFLEIVSRLKGATSGSNPVIDSNDDW